MLGTVGASYTELILIVFTIRLKLVLIGVHNSELGMRHYPIRHNLEKRNSTHRSQAKQRDKQLRKESYQTEDKNSGIKVENRVDDFP